MGIKKVYLGQKVALTSNPNKQLGTIVNIINRKVVEVKHKDQPGIIAYGIKMLVEYKGHWISWQ